MYILSRVRLFVCVCVRVNQVVADWCGLSFKCLGNVLGGCAVVQDLKLWCKWLRLDSKLGLSWAGGEVKDLVSLFVCNVMLCLTYLPASLGGLQNVQK